MSIHITITAWQVPYDQLVLGTYDFEDANEARDFINGYARSWWVEHDGDRSVREGKSQKAKYQASWGHEGFEPVEELGYNHARWELWGGETGLHIMLDETSYQRLHEEHYKHQFDDKGLVRPGYLINSYVAGHKPGGTTEAEHEKYTQQQAEGMAAIEAKFGGHTKQ